MVSVTAGQSPKVAANYFREHLTRDDYYREGERIRGEWIGKGAERLGLRGEVQQEDFLAVISNELDRFDQQSRPRRSKNCHYDFTFTAPKSVSILSMRDERIRDLHLHAVRKAFAYMESLARVRDRRGELVSSETTRTTDSLAAGLFLHESSRSNDPNLHVHTVLANLSFDQERQGWLALQAAEMYRQRRLLDKIALAELAHGLRTLGYRLERTEHAFEIQDVGSDLIERFSQRRMQVQRLAEELRADSTRLTLLYVKYKLKSRFDTLSGEEKSVVKRAVGSLTDAEIRELATLETRPEKEAKTRSELLALMNRRLSAADSHRLDQVIAVAAARQQEDAVAVLAQPATDAQAQALRYALDHELERASAVSEPRLLETLLHHANGSVRFDEAQAALLDGPVIRITAGTGRAYVTTSAVLAEEKAVVDFVRSTRGTCRQLAPTGATQAADAFLSPEQRFALDHICTSRDRVIALRGIAGTGKTTLLRESLRVLHEAGQPAFLFAPTSEASRGVLRKEAATVNGDSPTADAVRTAFRRAETVEKLLTDVSLQTAVAGRVLWIDEAGLLSMPAMRRVFDLADKLGCRVVLAGDVAQHVSVERGDALRVLEKHAGLKPAELGVIRRQRRAEYRQVIEAFASSDVERGCRRLRKLGAWREIAGENERYEQLARDYAALVVAGKEVLAVSPTHVEGERVVQAVRARLREVGLITGEERTFERLVNLHLTTAQKTSAASYCAGQVVQFVGKAGEFAAGERVLVVEAPDRNTVSVERSDGRRTTLDLRQARAFSVHESAQIHLATGDKVRVTRNGSAVVHSTDPTSLLGYSTRVDNGTLLTVDGFSAAGGIECAGGLVLAGDFGHFASGYCLTSHASQGKTVDHVLLAENSVSAQAAGSLKQGYVSLSRGREDVRVYTDDRRAVEAAWANDGERLSALDLVAQQKQRRRQRSLTESMRWMARRLARRLKQAFHRSATPSPGSGRQMAARVIRTIPIDQTRPTRKNRPTL